MLEHSSFTSAKNKIIGPKDTTSMQLELPGHFISNMDLPKSSCKKEAQIFLTLTFLHDDSNPVGIAAVLQRGKTDVAAAIKHNCSI